MIFQRFQALPSKSTSFLSEFDVLVALQNVAEILNLLRLNARRAIVEERFVFSMKISGAVIGKESNSASNLESLTTCSRICHAQL